jgi:hypothetical protein
LPKILILKEIHPSVFQDLTFITKPIIHIHQLLPHIISFSTLIVLSFAMKVTTALLIAVGLLVASVSALPTKAYVASALEHKQERRWFYVGAYINTKADEPPPDSSEHQQERRYFYVSPAGKTKADEPPPDDSP